MSEILEKFCASMIAQHKNQFVRISDIGDGEMRLELCVGKAKMRIRRSHDGRDYYIELYTIGKDEKCALVQVPNESILRTNCRFLFQSFLEERIEEQREKEMKFIEDFKKHMNSK